MSTKVSKNFWRSEFACRCGCGFDTVDIATVRLLQELRDWAGFPVRITSGCRCPEHNAAVGGAENSQHLRGRAADVQIDRIEPSRVADWVETHHPSASVGRYSTFTHIDTRTDGPARWGDSQ